ncbi:MAG: hypothetical protein JW395_0308 [Nitrospira sp.]|nr:hypothetical protein [Nitrospira sp.]
MVVSIGAGWKSHGQYEVDLGSVISNMASTIRRESSGNK